MPIKLNKCLLILLSLFAVLRVNAGVTSLVDYKYKSDISIGEKLSVIEPDGMYTPANALLKRENIVRLVYSRDQRTDIVTNGDWSYKIDYKIYSLSSPGSSVTASVQVSYSNTQPVYENLKVHSIGFRDAEIEILNITLTGPGTIPDDVYLELETKSTRQYLLDVNNTVATNCQTMYINMLADVSPGGAIYTQPLSSQFWMDIEAATTTALPPPGPPYALELHDLVNNIVYTAAGASDPNNFHSHWPELLVLYHPNYNLYLACLNNPSSYGLSFYFNHNDNTAYWSYITGAEEYDLEYVFIDAELDGAVQPTTAADAFEFKEPTRITTTANSYQIDLTYPEGDLYFRMRPVGKYITNVSGDYSHIKSGSWLYANKYSFAGASAFELPYNWQFLNTFAEDGKHKSVISYYDGSFRNRQQQTNLSTNEVTVVGETKYDHEGRGVVNILPVPKLNEDLFYTNDFNTDLLGNSFEKENFDKGVHEKLSDMSGAGQYYSSNNPFTDDLYRNFIPDANGYAYSQVEYTRDNTGRISKTSGVGETHKLKDIGGNETKETKYFYGTPNSTELHRMFGANVGVASHYKKSMVIDPNGQVSLTYLNQEGKTVATCLAGDSPDNLIELDYNSTDPITVSLNDNNIIDDDNHVSVNSSTILNVLQNTQYDFVYDLTGVIYESAIAGPNGIPTACIDCVYDLEIAITGPCGEPVQVNLTNSPGAIVVNDVIYYTYSNGSSGSAPCASSYPTSPMVSFSANFSDLGNYNITKTLTINGDNLETDLQIALDEAGLGNDYLDDLIEQYQSSIDLSLCDFTCEQYYQSCYDEIVAANPTWTSAQIEEGVQMCLSEAGVDCDLILSNAINSTVNGQCQAIYQSLLEDVRPGGWVYNQSTSSQFWQDVDAALNNLTLTLTYVDANGNNNICSASSCAADPNNYENNWAELLVIYHPGYCHYELCLALEQSKVYDAQMAQATAFSQSAFTLPLTNDPVYIVTVPTFSNPNLGSFVQGLVSPELTNFNASGLSLAQYVDYSNNSNTNFYSTNPTPTTQEKDELKWTLFRGFYQQIKTQALNDYYQNEGCSYDDITILEEPVVIESVDDFNNLLGGGIGDFNSDCEDVCASNVEFWMSQLEASCGPFSSQEETDLKNALSDYCSTTCGLGNPLGAIINDPNNPPSNPFIQQAFMDLQAAFNASSTLCDLTTLVTDPYDDNCGSTYTALSLCSRALFDFFKDEILPYAVVGNTSPKLISNFPQYSHFFDCYNSAPEDFIEMGSNNNAIQLFRPGGGGGYDIVEFRTSAGIVLIDDILELVSYGYSATVPSFTSSTSAYQHVVVELKLKPSVGGGTIQAYVFSSFTIPNENFCIPIGLNCADFGITQATPCFENILDFFNNEIFPTYTGGNFSDQMINYPNYYTMFEECYGTTNPPSSVEMVSIDQSNNDFGFTINPSTSYCNNVFSLDPYTVIPIDITKVEKIHSPFYNANIQVPGVDILSLTLEEKQLYGGNTYTVYYNSTFSQKTCFLVLDCYPTVSLENVQDDCIDGLLAEAAYEAQQQYQNEVDEFSSQFIEEYYNNCFASPFAEDLYYNYDINEYHYTLYYYDQAGNLVQTVPPQGVNLLDASASGTAFTNGIYDGVTPVNHDYETHYAYNSFNQLRKQETPDAGVTDFWYNDKTQLRYSQNAKQNIDGNISYTKYDNLGRITEVGESLYPLTLINPNDGSYPTTGTQVTKTFYDDQAFTFVQPKFNDEQQNLRNRVSSVVHYNGFGQGSYSSATHYSYDAHGNVNELLQEDRTLNIIKGNTYKKVDYEYDLISGNVNKVEYQKGKEDQFFHRYCYDADNRIINAETSTDGYIWDNDATYFYYLHGPLARMEVGEDKVQATDYAYTVQGWIKGNNSSTIDENRDMGQDGRLNNPNNLNTFIARDAYGYSLGYFEDDYASITNLNNNFLATTNATPLTASVNTNLYNGNISHMVTAISNENEVKQDIMGYAYKYDQLNRIKQMDAFTATNIAATNSFASAALPNPVNGGDYHTEYTYDKNGNIASLYRNGDAGNQMDELEYHYYDQSGTPDDIGTFQPNLATNKLSSVDDNVSSIYSDDIEDMPSSYNYDYDAIGNLSKDLSEDIDNIDWTVYGKIKTITRTVTNASGSADISFSYDPNGNRILKVIQPDNSTQVDWVYHYYKRDASGNIMANYTDRFEDLGNDLYKCITELQEVPLYGSSRLGVNNKLKTIKETTFAATINSDGTFNFNPIVISLPDFSTARVASPSTITFEAGSDGADFRIIPEEEMTINATTALIDVTINGETTTVDYMVIPAETDVQLMSSGDVNVTSAAPVYFDSENPVSLKFIGSLIEFPGHISLPLFTYANYSRQLDNKQYEFSNHLGNVLDVVSDRKLGYTTTPANSTLSSGFESGEENIFTDSRHLSMLSTTPTNTGNFSIYQEYPATQYGPQVKIKVQSGDVLTNASIWGYTTNVDPTKEGKLVKILVNNANETLYLDQLPTPTPAWEAVDGFGQNNWQQGVFTNYPIPNQLYLQDGTLADPNDVYLLIYTWIPPGEGPTYFDDISVSMNWNNVETYYLADVKSYSDYYPFGSLMPGRYSGGNSYRYGLGGQEKIDEVYGVEGSYVDYTYRGYNARLGRFMSEDPIASSYPELTPYQFAGNTPIWAKELEGLEPGYTTEDNINVSGSDRTYNGNPNYVDQNAGTNSSEVAENKNWADNFNFQNLIKSQETTISADYTPKEIKEQHKFNMEKQLKIAELQKANPFVYGGSGFGAGSNGAVYSAYQTFSIIEGGYGVYKLGVGAYNIYKSYNAAKSTFLNSNFSLSFSLGKQVNRYVPSSYNLSASSAFNANGQGLLFATNLNTTSRTRAYFDLGLNYSKSTTNINQITNYTKFTGRQWGIVMKGTVGPQVGGIGGGATQYVGFGLSGYSNIFKSGTAVKNGFGLQY